MRIRLTATVVIECEATDLFTSKTVAVGLGLMQAIEEEELHRKGSLAFLSEMVDENEWQADVQVKVEQIAEDPGKEPE